MVGGRRLHCLRSHVHSVSNKVLSMLLTDMVMVLGGYCNSTSSNHFRRPEVSRSPNRLSANYMVCLFAKLTVDWPASCPVLSSILIASRLLALSVS